ncbi:MAG: lipid-A-disaccharide synthase, partial [Acetobacteraceae bacterium]|nr:lipid-A-disaccharide synthase [Acetobacteraceae bacterium]
VRLRREPGAAAGQRAAFAAVLAMLRPAPGVAPSDAAAEAVLGVVGG